MSRCSRRPARSIRLAGPRRRRYAEASASHFAGALSIHTIGLAYVLFAVVLLTVSQLIIKSRLNRHGPVPLSGRALACYATTVAGDVRLIGGFATLVVAAFAWYAGLSRVPLSMAFPVAALTYPLIFLSTILVLKEKFSWTALAGNLLIVCGVVLASSGR